MGNGGSVSPPPPDPAQQDLERQQASLLSQQNQIITAQFNQEKALQPMLYTAMGLQPTLDASGNVTGLTQTPEAAAFQTQQMTNATAQGDLTSMLLNQEKQAINGTLPVNPAVQQSLDLSEQNLHDTLRASLGNDYATSTPGIQALKSFEQAKQATIFGANTGQMTLAEQLANANQAGSLGGVSNLAQVLQQISGGQNSNLTFGSNLSQLFGQAQQPYQFGQQMNMNAQIQNAMIGSASSGQTMGLIGGLGGAGLTAAAIF